MTSILGKRIKKARDEAGLSQQDLANAISNLADKKKITRTAIAQWESGVTKTIEAANLLKAAHILNVRPEWLQFGDGNMRPNSHKFSSGHKGLSIPILNHSQAINYTLLDEVEDFLELDKTLSDIASPNTFALSIQDTSMLPLFNPCDLIIIDPMIKPRPGEIVVAKSMHEDHVIIRKYRPLLHHPDPFIAYELIPFNDDWPRVVINNVEENKIIGTLIEHRCRRRIKKISR